MKNINGEITLTESELLGIMAQMYSYGEDNSNSFNQGGRYISALDVIKKYFSDMFTLSFLQEPK